MLSDSTDDKLDPYQGINLDIYPDTYPDTYSDTYFHIDVDTYSNIDSDIGLNRCFICLIVDERVIKPCPCSMVHYECLVEFINSDNRSKNVCHICNNQYDIDFNTNIEINDIVNNIDYTINDEIPPSDSICYRILYNIFIGILCCSWLYLTFGFDSYIIFGSNGSKIIDSNTNMYFFIIGGICSQFSIIYQFIFILKYRNKFTSTKLLLCFIFCDIAWAILNQSTGYAYLSNSYTCSTPKYFTLYNYLIGMSITFLPIMTIIITIHVMAKF